MSHSASIHLNGHKYDAHTGKRIDQPKSHQTMDGIVRSGPTHHKPASHHAAHVPKKAVTLSRAAVKKPQIISEFRHVPITEVSVRPLTPSHESHIKRSRLITHFSAIEPRPVHMPPVSEPMTPLAHEALELKTPTSHAESHLQKQLDAATAHNEKPHKKKRLLSKAKSNRKRRALSFTSGVAALLLIGGFVVYQSIPSLSLSLASRRAGFTAVLPKNTPSGFKVDGPVAYAPGRVVVSFSTNTDERRFQVEQKPTSLTTEGLKNQVAKDSGNQYQTYEQGGLTIFFSGDNEATWIDGEVMFSLKGDSQLSSDQIASIASSM